jgi:hypothetical protein
VRAICASFLQLRRRRERVRRFQGVPGTVRQPVGHHLLPRAVSDHVGAEVSGDVDALTLVGAQTWPPDGTDWRRFRWRLPG